ncbi:polymorphic toxin-type HINT domain-containing protein [Paenibacillus sinensis]
MTDTSYTYDLLNTLTSVTKGSSTTSFQYYADGLRYLKSTGNSHTQVNYDFNGQVITEEKLNGSSVVQQSTYVRGDRLLVKKDKTAGKDYYYLYNGHGDVVQIVDTSGNVVNSYSYDVWGNITSQTEGVSNSFKYAGEMYDAETGLYYLRARYYDPSIGRFINEDTVEGQIDNPLSLNLYTYVGNNPLIRVDPSGNSWISDQWYSFVVQMKSVHSSWESAMSFWTLGFTDPFFTSAKVPMNSKEYWYAQAEVIFNTATLGVGTFEKKATLEVAEEIPSVVRVASKACNCFTGGTKVQTDEGEKNIEDIKVGDKVLSKDETTGEVAYKEVTATFNHETDEIYQIHVGGQTIESTFNHPFYVKDKGWTFVKDLKPGDLLVQSDGNTLRIESIKLLNKHVTVYNMTVETFHTYFVSDLGIWVHNSNCFNAAGFEKRISNMSVNERVATVRNTASKIASKRGWTKDSKLTRINGRDVYYDSSSGNYYALDTQHGRFEVVNKRGKHQGEVNFNLDPTKAADTKGGHDLIMK